MTRRSNPWLDPEFAGTYAKESADPGRGWYELEVNAPSVLGLIPANTKSVLDFGCGPGDFTSDMAKRFPRVEGCDSSQPMIDIARKLYAKVPFFVWDGRTRLPTRHGPYDAVIAKLVFPFIHDLRAVAQSLRHAVLPEGVLVISMAHPIHTAKQVNDYWKTSDYQLQIGRFGIYDVAIHRSLETLVSELLCSGFVLTGLAEPETPDRLAREHLSRPDEFALPKRINLRFQLTKDQPS